MSYVYTKNNLLENKESYHYARFDPKKILESWRKDREDILLTFNSVDGPSSCKQNLFFSNIFDTYAWILLQIEKINHQKTVDDSIGLFLSKFEIRKRIYTFYSDIHFKIHPEADDQCIGLYVLAGSLFVHCYDLTRKMQFLNSLVKIMDIICSYHKNVKQLSDPLFKTLLKKEISYIDQFLTKGDR